MNHESTVVRIARSGIVVLVFFALLPLSGIAQTNYPDTRISGILDSIRVKHDLPALAAAVLQSEGAVFIGVSGTRRRGNDTAITVNDRWHLGSDTKAMTAALIGVLVEQGKLKWGSTIASIFPDIARTLPKEFRRATVADLLAHRAGLPENADWESIASRSTSVQEQRLDALRSVSTMKLSSPPGRTFRYSNLGYVIAGAIAEKVMGRPWEELMHMYVFTQLGMLSAGFGGTGTPGVLDQPWGHTADGKPVEENGPSMDNPPVMGPAGTVHCTLRDWAKFVADQLKGARGRDGMLKKATYAKLQTPPADGQYALGWIVVDRPWGGGRVLTHGGSNTMNFALVWMAPKRDFAILVCANQGGAAAAKGCDEAAGALINMQLGK